MDDLKKKVRSSLRKKLSEKRDKKKLERSLDFMDDVFLWYTDGGPGEIAAKMDEKLVDIKKTFNEVLESIEKGMK